MCLQSSGRNIFCASCSKFVAQSQVYLQSLLNAHNMNSKIYSHTLPLTQTVCRAHTIRSSHSIAASRSCALDIRSVKSRNLRPTTAESLSWRNRFFTKCGIIHAETQQKLFGRHAQTRNVHVLARDMQSLTKTYESSKFCNKNQLFQLNRTQNFRTIVDNVQSPYTTVMDNSESGFKTGLYGVTFSNVLGEENKQRVSSHIDSVQPVRTLEMMGMKKGKPGRVAAVLVPLCVVDGMPSVLLTLRSSSLRKHRGEVSFPGGNQDDTDPDITFTALRETFEEIGLNPRHFEVWGTLKPCACKSGAVAYPVLARYTQPLDVNSLLVNSEEVEEVFTCTIKDLCSGGKIKFGSTQFRTKPGYTLPVYVGGPHRIWGLSAIVLHQVLHLIAPGLYTYKIHHVA